MSPFIHLVIDSERFFSLRSLGDTDSRPARVHFFDDPIAIEGFVSQKRIEGQAVDQWRDADCVVVIARQEHEPDEVAERVCKRQNLGGPAAFGLAYSLTQSPPFAPCPAR